MSQDQNKIQNLIELSSMFNIKIQDMIYIDRKRYGMSVSEIIKYITGKEITEEEMNIIEKSKNGFAVEDPLNENNIIIFSNFTDKEYSIKYYISDLYNTNDETYKKIMSYDGIDTSEFDKEELKRPVKSWYISINKLSITDMYRKFSNDKSYIRLERYNNKIALSYNWKYNDFEFEFNYISETEYEIIYKANDKDEFDNEIIEFLEKHKSD